MPRMYDNGMRTIQIPTPINPCKITTSDSGETWACATHDAHGTHPFLHEALDAIVEHVACEAIRSSLHAIILDLYKNSELCSP